MLGRRQTPKMSVIAALFQDAEASLPTTDPDHLEPRVSDMGFWTSIWPIGPLRSLYSKAGEVRSWAYLPWPDRELLGFQYSRSCDITELSHDPISRYLRYTHATGTENDREQLRMGSLETCQWGIDTQASSFWTATLPSHLICPFTPSIHHYHCP